MMGVAALGVLGLGVAVLRPEGAGPRSEAAPAPSWVDALADRAAGADFGDPAPGPIALPADHGPHEDVSSESWQVFVDLDGAGVLEAAILRLGLDEGGGDVPWDVAHVYRAHTVFHAPGSPPHAEERFARAFSGLAGATDDRAGVRVDHWTLGEGANGAITLEATVGDTHRVSLTMVPAVAMLEAGTGAEAAPVKGYSFPRLDVSGTLTTPQGARAVGGTGWLDHYWGALPLPGAGPVALDRWQLHLDDGRSLSLVRSRRTDGRGAAETDGVVIGRDGAARPVEAGAYKLEPSRTWRAPGDGTDWPVAWVLDGPDTRLTVEAARGDALMPFALPVWSGPVRAEGRLDGTLVSGRGLMQLTGYGE